MQFNFSVQTSRYQHSSCMCTDRRTLFTMDRHTQFLAPHPIYSPLLQLNSSSKYTSYDSLQNMIKYIVIEKPHSVHSEYESSLPHQTYFLVYLTPNAFIGSSTNCGSPALMNSMNSRQTSPDFQTPFFDFSSRQPASQPLASHHTQIPDNTQIPRHPRPPSLEPARSRSTHEARSTFHPILFDDVPPSPRCLSTLLLALVFHSPRHHVTPGRPPNLPSTHHLSTPILLPPVHPPPNIMPKPPNPTTPDPLPLILHMPSPCTNHFPNPCHPNSPNHPLLLPSRPRSMPSLALSTLSRTPMYTSPSPMQRTGRRRSRPRP